MTTDATGAASLLFVPSYSRQFWTPGVLTAGDFVYSSFASGSRLSGVATYRIVSLGVRVRRVAAPLSSSGMLHVRGYATKTGGYLPIINPTTYNCDYYSDIAYQDCDEVCIVGRKLDETAKFFVPPLETTPTTVLSDWVSPGWGAFTVSVLGGPASAAVLDVEVFLNMEVTFEDTESTALLTTPAIKPDPLTTAIVERISSEAKTVFENGYKQVASYVRDEASKALGVALRRQVAGMIMG